MAQTLASELSAIHAYLTSAGKSSEANFRHAVTSQLRAMQGKILLLPAVSIVDATALIDKIQEGPWPPAEREQLCGDITRAAASVPKTSPICKFPMQGFMHVENYLNQPVWDILISEENFRVKLRTFAEHLCNLGMRCPSEKSIGALTGFFLFVTEGKGAIDMHNVHKLSAVHELKKLIKTCGQVRGQPLAVIHEFPSAAHDFQKSWPEIYDHVFKEHRPIVLAIEVEDLGAVIRSTPCRKTKNSQPYQAPTLRLDDGPMSQMAAVATKMFSEMGAMQQMQMKCMQQLTAISSGSSSSSDGALPRALLPPALAVPAVPAALLALPAPAVPAAPAALLASAPAAFPQLAEPAPLALIAPANALPAPIAHPPMPPTFGMKGSN
jgi:hypothetical protein